LVKKKKCTYFSTHHPDYDKCVLRRILKNSDKVGDCLLSKLKSNKNGYIYTKHRNDPWLFHRLSFHLQSTEPLIPGMIIHHLCYNKNCFHISHLKQMSRSEHVILENKYRLSLRPKGECKNVHKTINNLYIDSQGYRICRTCRNISNKKYRRKQRELKMVQKIS